MLLTRALRLEPGQALTLTGAGGKTSALRQLAQELAPGTPLLVTTTTHFGIDQLDFAALHLTAEARPNGSEIGQLLAEHRTVALTGAEAAGGAKWSGVPAAWIDELKAEVAAVDGCIVVEGDGARQRPLKAPADHEPVVPASSDRLIPVVGVDALGARLTEKTVHRPARFAELTGCSLGERIRAEHLVRLLTSPQGALKGRPAGAPVRALLNAVGTGRSAQAVSETCLGALRGARVIEAAILAEVGGSEPVREVRGRTAGVILAAGGSDRMAGLKQLQEWRGRPLVSWALAAAEAAALAPLIMVVGEGAERVRAVAKGHQIEVVDNPDWASGQSSSLKAGLRAALAANSEAVIFLLSDMPLVDAELLAKLEERHRASLSPIVVPRAGGRWGNPVLFDRATYPALLAVEGDRGGRAIFDRFQMEPVEADESALIDIDTEEDWHRLG